MLAVRFSTRQLSIPLYDGRDFAFKVLNIFSVAQKNKNNLKIYSSINLIFASAKTILVLS